MYPKLIEIGDFYLPTYGLLVAAAFLVALAVTTRLARKAGLSEEKVLNLALGCAFAGLLGAKLTMFLFDWEYYSRHPGEVFSIATLQAMGVYQGGIVLAIVVGWWMMRRYGLPVPRTMDVFAPGLALGHGVGRLGCFAAGCCWGIECDRPWAVTFMNLDSNRMVGVPIGVPLHPAQLYEAAAETAIFFVLYRFFQRSPQPGAVFGLYLVLYSAVRFVVEFYRNHEQSLKLGLSNTQWISLAMLALGALVLMRRSSQPRTAVVS